MTDQFDIRPLGTDDRAAWEPLWRAYLAFYGTDVAPEVYDSTFARYVDPNRADMRGWMARDDNTALGLVHAVAHPHGWRLDPVTYLQDLFTAPAARGKGVARALIETVYADADASGRPSVYWLTQDDNTAARALYDRIAQATNFIKYNRA